MKLDKDRGRYTLVNARWLHFFVRTPKTDEGWEVLVEIGPKYRGPGFWFNTGVHSVYSMWLTGNRSVDVVHLCNDCHLCRDLYKLPLDAKKKKWKVSWY